MKLEEKTKNNLYIAGGIGLFVLVVWLVVKFWPKEETPVKKDTSGEPVIPPASSNILTGSNDEFPLQKGSKGNRVVLVQEAINRIVRLSKYPNATISADGSFGTKTYEALITFVGTRFYPVTPALFVELIKKSNPSYTGITGGASPQAPMNAAYRKFGNPGFGGVYGTNNTI